MSNENTTTQAPAATFAQFLVDRNSKSDEIGSFHHAMGDHGLEFPRSASEFIEAVSAGTTGDEELQHNVEVLAHNMLEAGNYLLMALIQHQKNQQEAA